MRRKFFLYDQNNGEHESEILERNSMAGKKDGRKLGP